MFLCKRIIAALTLLLSLAGLLISLVIGIGIWFVADVATARVNQIFVRIESGLDAADNGLRQVRASLLAATEHLDSVRQDQKKISEQPQKKNVMRKAMARSVQQNLAPKIGDAHEKLRTVAEATVVVNSVLEDLSNIPSFREKGLDRDHLVNLNHRLAEVGPAAWELSRLLGEPDTDADAATEITRVEQALQRMQGQLNEFEPRLQDLRQRTTRLKERSLYGITTATVLVSALSFWIGISQISLMVHAWGWRKRKTDPSAGHA